MLKVVLPALLIVFVLVGNMGMSVFTHYCEEDGVFRSYFVETQDHCSDDHDKTLPACCSENVSDKCSIAISEKDCCSDEVNIFKIKLDYHTDYQLHFNLFSEVTNSEIFTIISEDIRIKGFNPLTTYHPPPKPKGRQILITKQVFQI